MGGSIEQQVCSVLIEHQSESDPESESVRLTKTAAGGAVKEALILSHLGGRDVHSLNTIPPL